MVRRRNYKYGRQKEKLVAKKLQSKGFKTNLSPASKGPSDIGAEKGNRKWCVQVKATRGSGTPRMSKEEIRRLKIQASHKKCVPVIAEVSRNNIIFKSVRTGRKLRP